MASNPQDVRQAAVKEMARRELERRRKSAGQSGNFVGPVPTGAELAASNQTQATKKFGLVDAARAVMTPGQRGALGLGEAALSVGTGMVSSPVNAFWNAGMEALELPTGKPVGTYIPRSQEGRSLLGGMDKAMRLTHVPQAIEKMLDLQNPDPAVRATGNLIEGVMGVLPAVGSLKAMRAERAAAIPTRAAIKEASQQAYARAEAGGGMLPQNQLGAFVTQAEQMLAKEGFDADLNPKTYAALKRFYEDATKPGIAGHSVQGAEILRRVLLNAEKEAMSAGKAGEVSQDAMMAGKLLDDFDDFMDRAMPSSSAEYATARNLWSVQRKAQDIEAVIEKAKNQAGGYSVSGMENALRNQFKLLADNPRRFNRYTPQEKAAILRVARNGFAQASLRLLGKAAPTGNVSWLTILAAEGVAPGSGLALAGTGFAGRLGATALRTRNARKVEELVRSGALQSMPSRLPNSRPLPQLGYLPANALATNEASNALYRDEEQRRNALAR